MGVSRWSKKHGGDGGKGVLKGRYSEKEGSGAEERSGGLGAMGRL